MLPLGVALDNVLIDASLAIVALAVGFFAALWYSKNLSGNNSSKELGEEETRRRADQENDAERTNMAALQLRDLAKNVALDVGEHNLLVNNISDELGSLHGTAIESQAAVAAAIAKILSANEKLQDRLEEAEQKIQAQAEEIRAQQSEARTDSLTSLANRRAFDDVLDKNLGKFETEGRPFSLVMFDVDHFKKFNDTHGHQAGDEVLRSVAKTATQSVKSTDVVCRYGGEEFAVVLPNTRIDSARISAEKIRESIAGQKINFEGKSLQVTASIGVAEIASDENAARIIRHSDEAVYAAKNAGRNRTFWHDGQTCLELGAKSSAENEPLPKVAPNETQVGSGLSSSLPGRELFTGELQRRVSESHRFGVSLSVLFVRIKDFASLENNYGIAVGNFLLDSVAQFIRGSLRDMDLLGRLEEGDFVVMLPGSSEREAKLVGSRVQSSISNCTIPLGGQKVRLNVLQGVTDVYPDDDAEKMIQRSEEVMLDNFAKQQRAVPV